MSLKQVHTWRGQNRRNLKLLRSVAARLKNKRFDRRRGRAGEDYLDPVYTPVPNTPLLTILTEIEATLLLLLAHRTNINA
jgi:hypothetical protein